MKNANKCHLF